MEKEELELELLKAQIAATERTGTVRSTVASMMIAIVTSITASVAVGFFITYVGDNYLESKNLEIKSLQQEISKIRSEKKALAEDKIKAELDLKKVVGAGTSYDQGIDISIAITPVTAGIDTIKIASKTPKIQIEAYQLCSGTFIFPGNIPPFETGNCHKSESLSCNVDSLTTSCEFEASAKGTFEAGVWIRARTQEAEAIRYVSLSGS